MNQRDLIYKWLFYSLTAALFLLIQGLVLNRLPLWGGVHPFLLPMIAISPAVMENRDGSSLFAVIFGFFCDLLFPGPFPGMYVLVFLLGVLLTGQLAGRVIVPGFLCALLCSAAALVICDIFCFLSFSGKMVPFSEMLSIAGRELVLSLPFSPLIFWPCRKIALRMREL